ncbi:hypothetical protein MKX08_003391 [Trichoderma sp. CBMAI-0020]|nr:hypothetical protein MKX08_003391 [Trichoderma sp. CBMAI-0020]
MCCQTKAQKQETSLPGTLQSLHPPQTAQDAKVEPTVYRVQRFPTEIQSFERVIAIAAAIYHLMTIK